MELVKLTKTCLNEACSRVRVGKHLPDTFPVKNCWKKEKETSFRHCFSTLLYNLHLRGSGKAGGLEINTHGTDHILVYVKDINVSVGSFIL
jgi:hypothetical protein